MKLKDIQTIIFLLFSVFLILISSCSSFKYEDELVEVYYNLGNAYSELGKLDKSSAAFVRALQIDPSFPSAAYNLGIVQIQSGNYKNGIKVLNDLLKMEPENILIMKILAWGYFKNNDLDRSISTYELILQIDPNNEEALNNITILMISNKMFEKVYPHLVQLEAIGVDDSNNLYNLGITERELEISSGLDWFELAYEKEQNLEKNLVALIDVLTDKQDYKRVVELYDVLIGIKPSPDLYFDKAFILLTSIEDYDLGISALESALKNGFADLERIDELKFYEDLLDRDKILSVFIDYPPKESGAVEEGIDPVPEESPAIPEQSPVNPELESVVPD